MGTGEQLGGMPEELRPTASQPYKFKHFDPEQERELIEAITLDTDKINDPWMERLDRLLELGKPRETHVGLVTVREIRQKRQARAHAEHELGVNNPAHSIHGVYAKLRLRPSTKGLIVPSTLITAVRALSNIAGNVTEAIKLFEQAPVLATYHGNAIQSRRTYGRRVASALGWQGDVDELIREFPEALIFGHINKTRVVAHMAARYGAAEDRTLPQRAAFYLLKRPAEPQINAIIRRGKRRYTLGRNDCTVARTVRGHQEFLYEALEDPSIARRVGHQILWAYFRLKPPTEKDQRAFPHVRPLIESIRHISMRNEAAPRIITGKEDWAQTLIPRGRLDQKNWLDAINRSVIEGSLPFEDRDPADPDYEYMRDARLRFFRLMGWTISRHPLAGALKKFKRQEPELVAPRNAVAIMNLLVSYGFISFERALLPDLRPLTFAPDAARAELETVIEEQQNG